ncbi:hypothetical protein ACJX0J_005612, partial [Zea mays]
MSAGTTRTPARLVVVGGKGEGDWKERERYRYRHICPQFLIMQHIERQPFFCLFVHKFWLDPFLWLVPERGKDYIQIHLNVLSIMHYLPLVDLHTSPIVFSLDDITFDLAVGVIDWDRSDDPIEGTMRRLMLVWKLGYLLGLGNMKLSSICASGKIYNNIDVWLTITLGVLNKGLDELQLVRIDSGDFRK